MPALFIQSSTTNGALFKQLPLFTLSENPASVGRLPCSKLRAIFHLIDPNLKKMAQISIKIGQGEPFQSVETLTLRQSVGDHHTFDLTLDVSNDHLDLLDQHENLIYQSISISFSEEEENDQEAATFRGFIRSARSSRNSSGGQLLLKGQSPTMFMSMGGSERTFVATTFKEIVQKVLQPYEAVFPETWIAPDLDRKIAFTAQREPDWNYLLRFRHPCYYDGNCLCIGWKKTPAIPLAFGKKLSAFDFEVNTIQSSIELGGFDFQKGNYWPTQSYQPTISFSNNLWQRLLTRGKTMPSTPSKWIEQNINGKEELAAMADSWLALQLGQMATLTGTTSNFRLSPGRRLSVEEATPGLPEGEYIVMAVQHHYNSSGYTNDITAVPKELLTKWVPWGVSVPLVDLEEAVVISRESSPDLGMITVRFDFDKERNESPPIRYLSPSDKHYVLPEPGSRVLCYFQGPDRPLCASGNLFTGRKNARQFAGKGEGFLMPDGSFLLFKDGILSMDGIGINIG